MLNLEGIIHMHKSRFLALSFLLALSGFGTAYAQAPALEAGTYKLAIGSKTPCSVTIAADRPISPSADCEAGIVVDKWAPTASGYLLISGSGAVYAVLKPNG